MLFSGATLENATIKVDQYEGVYCNEVCTIDMNLPPIARIYLFTGVSEQKM